MYLVGSLLHKLRDYRPPIQDGPSASSHGTDPVQEIAKSLPTKSVRGSCPDSEVEDRLKEFDCLTFSNEPINGSGLSVDEWRASTLCEVTICAVRCLRQMLERENGL